MFFRKKKSRGKPAVPDWRQQIPQRIRIGDTGAAKKRRRRSLLRGTGAALSAAVMIILVALVAERVVNAPDGEIRRFRIAKIDLKTDGALGESWVRTFIGDNENNAVASVGSIRKKLESYPQIRQASVARGKNDALRIELRERVAIARFRDASGEIFMVGDDGVLFPAKTYFGAAQQNYPFVKNAAATARPDGFQTLAGTPQLIEFLRTAFGKHRATMKTWESVDAKMLTEGKVFPERHPQPWRKFRVVLHALPTNGNAVRIREIIFSAQHFEAELELFDCAEIAQKLRGHFDPQKTYRVVFIQNLKNSRQPITEMRLIPDESAAVPAATARSRKTR